MRAWGAFATRTALTVAAATMLGAATDTSARLDVTVEGLRSTRGNLLICLSRDPAHFPDCSGDPQAHKLTVAAASRSAHFTGLVPGTYALSLIHDENGNGKLDTRLGIPREGVAFSRNPRLMFGAPSYASVRFEISGAAAQTLQMKYFL